MNNTLLGAVVTLGIFISPALALAQVQGDVAPDQGASSCLTLTHNLQYRSTDSLTGSDVSALQDFLQSGGYLRTEPTGYFGLLTVAAVKKFQSASGILSSGYVGPITRAKINDLSCSGTTITFNSDPVVRTTSPNTTDGCAPGYRFSSTTGAPCSSPILPPKGCASGAMYDPTTGQACSTTPITNQAAITVTSPTAGTNFSPGQTVSITWTTSGLSSNASYLLVYSKTGTDVAIGTYTPAQAHCDATNTCSVPWTIPAITDQVSVAVWETVAGKVGTTGIFSIGPASAAPTITVTYPNGGEQFVASKNVDFRTTWTSSNLSGTAYVYLSFASGAACLLGTVPVSQGTFPVTLNLPNSSRCPYISEQITTGQYKILILTNTPDPKSPNDSKGVNDSSDGYFTVTVPGSVTQPPTISVTGGGTPSAVLTATTGQPDTASYTIPFTVVAGASDVYISHYATRTTDPSSPTGGVNFDMTTSSTPNATRVVGETVTASNSVVGDAGNAYKILAGTSRAFTLNVQLKAVADGYDGIRLTGILYGPTSALGSSYTDVLSALKTNDVYLTLRGSSSTPPPATISVTRGTPTASAQMATVPNSGDQGTFTMPFTISAGGSDVYVGGHVGTDVTFTTTPTSSAGAVSLSGSTLTTASTVAGDSAGSYYKILAGTSRTFTLTAVYTATNMPGGAGYTGLMMTGISYGATSALGSTYTDLSSFKTNDIYLSYH